MASIGCSTFRILSGNVFFLVQVFFLVCASCNYCTFCTIMSIIMFDHVLNNTSFFIFGTEKTHAPALRRLLVQIRSVVCMCDLYITWKSFLVSEPAGGIHEVGLFFVEKSHKKKSNIRSFRSTSFQFSHTHILLNKTTLYIFCKLFFKISEIFFTYLV